MSTHHSVRGLVDNAMAALGRGNINTALALVHDFVERIITEPLCTSQVFASSDLDQLCMLIGRQQLAALAHQEVARDVESVTTTYVVSRLQRSGGHARLVQDLIRTQPDKQHLILSTEIGGPSDIKYFRELYRSNQNIQFITAPRGNFAKRLMWLQSELIKIQPAYLYLFNHHQDSVAVSALVPELGLKGSYFHHGDHHLCLGVHLSHLSHVDLHPMGFHYCQHELGINSRYLPLTFEDKHLVSVQTQFMQGGSLMTATAARSNKVEIPYYVSYVETIPRILKATGGRHLHIGKLTPWALRRIYTGMKNLGVPKDRFVYFEWTDSVWKALQKHQVDVYIASFPYGAGLTLIEAMGAGVPVIMHEHIYSRVLSGLELAYPEAFRWANPDDLVNHLANLTPVQLENERTLSRSQYENYHRKEILEAYSQAPDLFDLPVPALAEEYRPKYDEWAAWVETQLTFSRLIYRFAYRSWRKLRRWIS